MKQFKIKVFKHLLKNNKIGLKEQVFAENKFIDAKASLKGNFIEEVKKEKTKSVDDMTKAELIEFAETHDIEIDPTDKKSEILNQIKD